MRYHTPLIISPTSSEPGKMSSHSITALIFSGILSRVASYLHSSDEMGQLRWLTKDHPAPRLRPEEIAMFTNWVLGQSSVPTIYDAETWIKDNFNKKIPSTKVLRSRSVDPSEEAEERTVRGLMDQAIADVASQRREVCFFPFLVIPFLLIHSYVYPSIGR